MANMATTEENRNFTKLDQTLATTSDSNWSNVSSLNPWTKAVATSAGEMVTSGPVALVSEWTTDSAFPSTVTSLQNTTTDFSEAICNSSFTGNGTVLWGCFYNATNSSGFDNSTETLPLHSTTEVVLIALVVFVLIVLTAWGNIMVVLAFKLDKALQTVSNYFLLSLAVADFTIAVVSMPLYTVYLLAGYWPFGSILCDVWLSLDYTMSNASVANLLIISFDRYLSVTRPLTYRAKRTPKRAAIMIGFAWFISAVMWTPWIFAWPYIEGKRWVSDKDCYIQFLKTNTFLTIVTAVGAFYLPVTIMSLLYFQIYRETEKRQKGLAKLQAGKEHNGSKKSAFSSDDEGISSLSQRRSDSSPDLEDIDDLQGVVPGQKKTLAQRLICCKIDRDPDYLEESSSSEPPGSPDVDSPYSNATSTSTRPGLLSTMPKDVTFHEHNNSNAKHKVRSSPSNMMIPLLPVDSRRPSPMTPSTDITGTFSRHSDLSAVTGITDADIEPLMERRNDSMYTILIKLPADGGSNRREKPIIRMIADSDEDDSSVDRVECARSEDSDSSDNLARRRCEVESSFTHNVSFRPMGPPPPPPTGTPALGRRVMPHSHPAANTDPSRMVMQAKLAANIATKMKSQRARRKRQERKQEKKAAKTLSAILLAFIVTWTPYNLFTVVEAFCVGCIDSTLYSIGK